MAKLNLTHPLGNSAPIILPELVVEARPYAQIFEVRGDSSAIALHQPGLLPDQPNRSRDYPAWRALSLRPGGWLLIDMSEGAAVGHPFASSEEKGLCRLTDVSYAFACIRLSGPGARNLLAKGTPLDLRTSHFAAGQCARTWCAGFTIVLDCHDAEFNLYVDTSFAVSFWNWISDAADEFKLALDG
jgi:heterotetrameric sarcosine oxidase gamma subunit